MKIFKEIWKNNKEYFVDSSQIGEIRLGDLVALSQVVKAIKHQFPEIKIYVKPNHRLHELYEFFIPNFDFIHHNLVSNVERLFPKSINIWALSTYVYKFANFFPDYNYDYVLNSKYKQVFFNLLKTNKKFIFLHFFCPTSYSSYNEDRFFTFDFVKEIIDILYNNKGIREKTRLILLCPSALSFQNRQLINKIILPKYGDYVVIRYSSSLLETLFLLLHSYVFIGGDTGFSHISATIKNNPKICFYFYGHRSMVRHSHRALEIDYLILDDSFINADFSPKVRFDKLAFYCDLGINFKAINFFNEKVKFIEKFL